jgi:hypothetical protein
MLERIEGNGAMTIIVETASRFARDLIVQETGYAMLKARGIDLIAADSPGSFLDVPLRRSLYSLQSLASTVPRQRGWWARQHQAHFADLKSKLRATKVRVRLEVHGHFFEEANRRHRPGRSPPSTRANAY